MLYTKGEYEERDTGGGHTEKYRKDETEKMCMERRIACETTLNYSKIQGESVARALIVSRQNATTRYFCQNYVTVVIPPIPFI